MKTRQQRIDELFEKYGFFDKDGYLVPPDHPVIKKYEERLEHLSRKLSLKPQEEKEAMELIALDRAYCRELNKYILEQGVAEMDKMGDDEDDEDYIPEEDEDEDDDISDDGDYDSQEEDGDYDSQEEHEEHDERDDDDDDE